MNVRAPNKSDDHPMTIAIPRVLWWFRLWPFWKTFFERLGYRVVTNDPARPTPTHHDRASTIVEEACFPIQLLIDRTLAIADQAEAIFMPRLISVSPQGIMCPRFSGVPDIVQMVLSRSGCQPVSNSPARAPESDLQIGRKQTGCQPVLLAPIIDARPGRWAVRDAHLAMAAKLGVPDSLARPAFAEASMIQERFETDFEKGLNTLSMPDVFNLDQNTPHTTTQFKIQNRESKIADSAIGSPRSLTGCQPVPHDPQSALPRIALLGHPYLAYDWEFNLNLVEKLRSLGMWILPLESIPSKTTESFVKKLDKSIYWSSGREIMGAILSFFQNGGAHGVIYLSCFKCGVDGLLGDVVRWAARHQSKVVFLSLTLDGHDNEVGLMTRLEAFVDIVRHRV